MAGSGTLSSLPPRPRYHPLHQQRASLILDSWNCWREVHHVNLSGTKAKARANVDRLAADWNREHDDWEARA